MEYECFSKRLYPIPQKKSKNPSFYDSKTSCEHLNNKGSGPDSQHFNNLKTFFSENSTSDNPFSPEVKTSKKFLNSLESSGKTVKNSNFGSNDLPFFPDLTRKKDSNSTWVFENSSMLNKLSGNS